MSTTLKPILNALGKDKPEQHLAVARLLGMAGSYGNLPQALQGFSEPQTGDAEAARVLNGVTFPDVQTAANWLAKQIAEAKGTHPRIGELLAPLAEHFDQLGHDIAAGKVKPDFVGSQRREINLTALKLDPATYQFKSGGDTNGVTQKDRINHPYNAVLDDDMYVVHEKKNGDLMIADGHHRYDRAMRARKEGSGPETIVAQVFCEADGYSANDVEIIAAVKNIAHGSSKLADAALVLKEAAKMDGSKLPQFDLEKGNIPKAIRLSTLDKIIQAVQHNDALEQAALALAARVHDPEQQVKAFEIIKQELAQAPQWQNGVAPAKPTETLNFVAKYQQQMQQAGAGASLSA